VDLHRSRGLCDVDIGDAEHHDRRAISRRQDARSGGIMALGIAWNIGGVIFMFFLLSSMPEISAKTPAGFDVMWKVMLGFNVLFVAGFVWLFWWIIKRLMSDDVRREFAAV
jgi:hypothetical protein